MFFVPVTWIRKQIGKPLLPGGKPIRAVKFPADKNFYVFQWEIAEISKPRVYAADYIEETQKGYEDDPGYDDDVVKE